MPAVRLTLEYDGTGFYGWAVQPGVRTVQRELSVALETALREPVALSAAGRTDAGVHAWQQVAGFQIETDPPPTLLRSLNGLVPRDMAVLEAAIAPDGFDARRDALSRTYCYRILARSPASPFERDRALWWPYPLDRDSLGACAEAIVGKHDFTAFTPTQTEHVRFEREVYMAEWRERRGGDVLELWIEADSFMRSMVRILVGTMLEVAGGRRSIEDFRSLLEGAPRERAGETARPGGLYLARVRYDP